MASMLLLKRKIKTAQNVSKTTRAMQMIAASKLKRAQDAALSSRAYVEKLSRMTKNLSRKIDASFSHPYLTVPSTKNNKSLLIALSPDKGLCGGLIANVLREFAAVLKNTTLLVTVGKKIQRRASVGNLVASFPFGNTLPSFEVVYPIVNLINEHIASGNVGKVEVLYTHFGSLFMQNSTVATLLPIAVANNNDLEKQSPFTLFEPSIHDILPTLLARYVEMSLYQYFLESYLSEQAARLLAMQNASNNATEIIETLTLEYNKARQERITSEILDITSGSIFAYAQ